MISGRSGGLWSSSRLRRNRDRGLFFFFFPVGGGGGGDVGSPDPRIRPGNAENTRNGLFEVPDPHRDVIPEPRTHLDDRHGGGPQTTRCNALRGSSVIDCDHQYLGVESKRRYEAPRNVRKFIARKKCGSCVPSSNRRCANPVCLGAATALRLAGRTVLFVELIGLVTESDYQSSFTISSSNERGARPRAACSFSGSSCFSRDR